MPACCRRARPRRARSPRTCGTTPSACRAQARQASYETTGYKPRLSVDFVGQPTVGVGVDSFGTYVGGGISALVQRHPWQPHCGGHRSRPRTVSTKTGGSIIYLNRSRRWNYGVARRFDTVRAARHRPGSRAMTADTVLVQEDELRVIQTDRGFAGIAAYPFSRAQRRRVYRRPAPDLREAGLDDAPLRSEYRRSFVRTEADDQHHSRRSISPSHHPRWSMTRRSSV